MLGVQPAWETSSELPAHFALTKYTRSNTPRYNSPQAIHARYVAARHAWYDSREGELDVTELITTCPQQLNRSMLQIQYNCVEFSFFSVGPFVT